jgi:protein ImuB
LCIHLPRWSITRCCRRHPECRNGAIAIIHSIGQRRLVVDASDRAISLGVRDGMSAAEARALCGQLICIEQDIPADQRALVALGRWMMRFTPDVANGWDDVDDTAPAALFLDLTGCERLFGGIDPIVRQVRQSLSNFNIPAQMAVAPTPGAAWAFASAGNFNDAIIDAASLRSEVAALPITSLRLDGEIIADLHRLGLHRIGHLLAIQPDQLPSRFGPSLGLRLDQLIGNRIEPLARLIRNPLITSRMEFDSPVEAVEDIGLIFEQLLDRVLQDLTQRNHGVRQLRMILQPDRGWDRPIIRRAIALSRPHRDRATLLSLIRGEIERIDCEHGFIRFQLDVPLHEPMTDAQTQLFEQQSAQEQMELDRLFQRLRARLGESAVIRPEPVESYLPERAWRPARSDPPPAAASSCEITRKMIERSPPAACGFAMEAQERSGREAASGLRASPRPLTLFQMPVEIRVVSEPCDDRSGQPRQFTFQGRVHRLTHVIGPERIAGEWWRGHRHTRDYYDVEDESGRRFWIFRVLHLRSNDTAVARWFLHGRFD